MRPSKLSTFKCLSLLFSWFLFSSAAQAQGFGQDFPASDEVSAGMQLIESEDDVPFSVRMQEVVYAERDQMDLSLKIVSPGGSTNLMASGSSDPVPLVIYVQGSAWFPQDTAATLPRLSAFVEDTGYVVASVQYRPSTVAIAPAQLQDVKSAIRFMRANAGRFGIDPERIAVWGDSSGGHMAAMVGTTGGFEQFVTDDNAEQSSRVKAVVDFFGPTNFIRMQDYPSVMDHNVANSPESTVIGGPIQDPDNYDKVQAYNPISYISADRALPPFLIMHGDADPLVPFNQSVILYEALRDNGQQVDFYKIKGAGHGTRFYTPAVMAVMKDFLAEHL